MAAEIKGTALGRIRLRVIPDSTARTLIDTVEDLVEKGSDVVTDGLSSYAGLPASGFNHTVSRPAPHLGKNLLPHVPAVQRSGSTSAVSSDLLQYYLDEFVFRFNRRSANSRGLLFRRLAEQLVAHRPVTRTQLFQR